MSRPRILLIGMVIAILAILLAYTYTLRAKQNDLAKTATITVTAAPGDSKVSLNGHGAVPGVNRVKPGGYLVVISRSGFANASKTVLVTQGRNALVGFALVPNANATANWYLSHPDDAAIARTITDPKYSSSVAIKKAAGPISRLLPFTAGGFDFTIIIDPDSPDENNPIIYVESDTESAKQDALTWIKNQGYDPSRLNLKFISTTDPERP